MPATTVDAFTARRREDARQGERPRPEGPAVLRLRMLEVEHGLRLKGLDEDARRGAEATLATLRAAVLGRPALTFADVAARLRTQEETA
jgi:hypothetical protein